MMNAILLSRDHRTSVPTLAYHDAKLGLNFVEVLLVSLLPYLLYFYIYFVGILQYIVGNCSVHII